MMTLYVKYTAKPGCRESYVRSIVSEGILSAIRNEDGCLRYDYYFSAQEEDVVLLIEQWEAEEYQRIHMQQPHMARLRELKAQYIERTTMGKAELHDAV